MYQCSQSPLFSTGAETPEGCPELTAESVTLSCCGQAPGGDDTLLKEWVSPSWGY